MAINLEQVLDGIMRRLDLEDDKSLGGGSKQ